jgi:hypothetical protein
MGGCTVSELAAGVIGGAVGGILGVLGTTVSAYWGPRKLEQWRAERLDRPRKELLRRMLEDERYVVRTLERLCVVSGTTPDECRRLLISINARGVELTGQGEGWALISRKPLEGSFRDDSS